MRLLAVALVTAFIVAGCSGSTEDSPASSSTSSPTTTTPDDPSTSSTTSTTSSSTTSSPPAPHSPERNRAPEAVLLPLPRVAVAPANITFHIDADDEDASDTHSWRLSFGDGTPGTSGTETPFTVVHNYTAIGNYTAVLLVSDMYGVEDSVEQIVVLTPEYFPPMLFNGTADIACGGCAPAFDAGVVACIGFSAERRGVDCDWFALPANATFQPFTASSSGEAPDSDVGVIFADECDSDAAFIAGVDEGTVGVIETGEVPSGALCMIVYENNNVTNTFQVRVG